MKLYKNYKRIYEYFDDWILIEANEDYTDIEDTIVKKKVKIILRLVSGKS